MLKEAAGPDERRAVRRLRRLEPRRAGQLPDRDHPRHLQRQGPGRRRLPGRQDPRHGRRQGDRQVDEPARPRPGRAEHAGHRGGVRPLPVGHEGRARAGQQGAARARRPKYNGDKQTVHRADSAGAVRLEDLQLRPGLRAAAGGGQGARLAAELRQHVRCLWRGGCIIRARVPGSHQGGLRRRTRSSRTCCWTPYFTEAIDKAQDAWRHVVSTRGAAWASRRRRSRTALAYYDGYRRDRLPANLLQAQRDYFGAHTFERVDKPGVFHADWLDCEEAAVVRGSATVASDRPKMPSSTSD